MATYTDNFNLKKPSDDDFYNVKDFNGNADIIDNELKNQSKKLEDVVNFLANNFPDEWHELELADGITVASEANQGEIIKWKKEGNRIYIRGKVNVIPGSDGSAILTSKAIPKSYRPSRDIHDFATASSTRISRIYVSTNGLIYLDWCWDLPTSAVRTSQIAWIEIDLSYDLT